MRGPRQRSRPGHRTHLPAGPAGPPASLGGRDARPAGPSPAGGRPGKTPGRSREGPAAGGVPAGWPRSRRQGPSPRSRCEGRPAGQMAAPRRRALGVSWLPGLGRVAAGAGGRGGRISGGGAPSRSGGGAPGGPAQPASGRGPGAGGGGGKCCTTWTAGAAGGTDRTAKARAITQPMKLQPSRMLITAIAATPGMWRARATRVGSRYSATSATMARLKVSVEMAEEITGTASPRRARPGLQAAARRNWRPAGLSLARARRTARVRGPRRAARWPGSRRAGRRRPRHMLERYPRCRGVPVTRRR